MARRLVPKAARLASLDLESKAPQGVFGLAGDLASSAAITGASLSTVDVPDGERKRVMPINADGVFCCNRAVLPSMVGRGYGRSSTSRPSPARRETRWPRPTPRRRRR